MKVEMIEEMRGAVLTPEAREGERSEPGRAGGANTAPADREAGASPRRAACDPEVSDKAVSRRYSAAYKLKVLNEADRCTQPGETGALLRREGLYSSLLSSWRRQREASQLNGLAGKKPGRDGAVREKLTAEVKRLRRENRRLEGNLRRAEVVIDIQKKASELLGIPLNSPELDENE
jgi:transposase-like protein